MPAKSAERIADYTRLSRADEAIILKLAGDGRTQTEIAQLVGCSQPTVSRVIAEFADTRDIARRILHRDAASIAERLTQTKHAPTMLEILRDQKVSEKQAPAGEHRGGITVVIGVQAERVQLGGFASPVVTVSEDIHRLTADTGSDN
jgi:predicted transcriptional regulator